MKKFSCPFITIKVWEEKPGYFSTSREVTDFQLNKIATELNDRILKIEDACRCLDNSAEDEALRPEFADGLSDASSTLWKMHRFCEEGLDAIDEILEAERSMERNLAFLFGDVNEATKGGVA